MTTESYLGLLTLVNCILLVKKINKYRQLRASETIRINKIKQDELKKKQAQERRETIKREKEIRKAERELENKMRTEKADENRKKIEDYIFRNNNSRNVEAAMQLSYNKYITHQILKRTKHIHKNETNISPIWNHHNCIKMYTI